MALDNPSDDKVAAKPLTTDVGDLSRGGRKAADPVSHVVLDTAAFVGKRPHFDNISIADTHFWTTESVLREVRDKESKFVLDTFPYKIQTRAVSKEAMTAVSKFARLTGDLHALSRTDTEVIALTWMLEVETHGHDRIKSEPSMTYSLPGNKGRKAQSAAPTAVPSDAQKSTSSSPDTESTSSSKPASTEPVAPVGKLQAAQGSPPLSQSPQPLQKSSPPSTTSVPVTQNKPLAAISAPANVDVSTSTTQSAPPQPSAAWGVSAAAAPQSSSALSPAPALSFADRLKLANSQNSAQPDTDNLPKVTFRVRFGGGPPKPKTNGLAKRSSSAVASKSAPAPSPAAPAESQSQSTTKGESASAPSQPQPLSDSTNSAESESQAPDDDATKDEESTSSQPKKKAWHPMDSGEWITPDNVQEKLSGMGVDTSTDPAKQMSTVAVLTADYGMQNVILQMGLRLLSINGLSIRSLLQWYKKCAACFRTTREMEHVYCDWCGNATLYRVSVQIDPAGNVSIRENKRALANKRGTIYSIPKKKGGRNNSDLVLRADSLANVRTQQQRKKGSSGDMYDDAVEFATESDKSRIRNSIGKFGLTSDGRPQFGYGFRKNPNAVNHRSGKKSRKKKRR